MVLQIGINAVESLRLPEKYILRSRQDNSKERWNHKISSGKTTPVPSLLSYYIKACAVITTQAAHTAALPPFTMPVSFSACWNLDNTSFRGFCVTGKNLQLHVNWCPSRRVTFQCHIERQIHLPCSYEIQENLKRLDHLIVSFSHAGQNPPQLSLALQPVNGYLTSDQTTPVIGLTSCFQQN